MNDLITIIQNSYKLGFIHGATEMLRYIKERSKNQPIMQVSSRRHRPLRTRLLKNWRRAARKALKLELIESGMTQRYRLNTYEVMFLSCGPYYCSSDTPEPNRYYEDTEKDAIQLLVRERRKFILDILRREKKNRFIYEQNEKLKKL